MKPEGEDEELLDCDVCGSDKTTCVGVELARENVDGDGGVMRIVFSS